MDEKIMENPINMDEFGCKTHYFWKHPMLIVLFLMRWSTSPNKKTTCSNPKTEPNPSKNHHPQPTTNGTGGEVKAQGSLCVAGGCPSFDIRKLQFQLCHLPGTEPNHSCHFSEDGFFWNKKHMEIHFF